MPNCFLSQLSRTRQSGAALISGLIFLVVLTMIGITSARMSTLEERMSGNMRDRSIAMQAAELALRDAERDILTSGRISGISNFHANCPNGLCYPGNAGYANPIWTTVSMTVAPSVQYSAYTAAQDIPGVSAQPRYLIEGIPKPQNGGSMTTFYRITVRAQGINPNTVVWLQEVFRP